ncbi:MAG: hypothetical protein ACUVQ0_02675 [Thermoproteota archaeon]
MLQRKGLLKKAGRIRVYATLFLKATLITVLTVSVGFYSTSPTYHYVKNGLPFQFIIQTIDVNAARYVEVRIDYPFLFLDILLWACLIYLIRILRRIISPLPGADEGIDEHNGD